MNTITREHMVNLAAAVFGFQHFRVGCVVLCPIPSTLLTFGDGDEVSECFTNMAVSSSTDGQKTCPHGYKRQHEGRNESMEHGSIFNPIM